MNILFLSRWFPYPADNGSKLRISNLLKQLATQHTVDLISFTSEDIAKERLAPLQVFCHSVETVTYRPFQPRRFHALLGLFSPLPRSILDTDNREMHQVIRQKVRENQFDLLIASEVDMAQYIRHLPGKKIWEDIELAPLRDQVKAGESLPKRVRHILMWRKWLHYILTVMKEFDGCTVVSEPERKLVEGLLHKAGCNTPIQIVPNGIDSSRYQDDSGISTPNTMVYAGALTYSANYNAVDFFLKDVFPIIQSKAPDVKLTITGRLDGVPVERLPSRSGVLFTGYLDDIRTTISSSWVSIVPLQIGGGTRLKILESLALGTPVVSTSKGAEGLELVAGQDILLADSPDDFASAVLRLFADPVLRHWLSQNGKQAVAARYTWQTIGQSLNKFIGQICE